MKRVKFPKADKIIRKYTKNKKADLAVKVTPSGADRHPRFGSMHHTRCAISIEDSWDGYLFVTQEERMKFFQRDGICYVPIPSERFVLQNEYLDARYMENRTLTKKVQEKFSNQVRKVRRRPIKPSRDEEILRLENEVRKRNNEIDGLEKMLNVQKGALVDAIALGIIPPIKSPPFPLQHVSKLSRGPDALSIHSPEQGVLALDFIEGNWTSKKGEPGMTRTQRQIKQLLKEGEIRIRLWHHYQDGTGEWFWKKIADRKQTRPWFTGRRK